MKIFSYRLFNHNVIIFRNTTVYSMVTLKASIRCDMSSLPKWTMIHQYWQVCTMQVVSIQTPRNNSGYGALGQIPMIRRPICTERATVLLAIILSSTLYLSIPIYRIYIHRSVPRFGRKSTSRIIRAVTWNTRRWCWCREAADHNANGWRTILKTTVERQVDHARVAD